MARSLKGPKTDDNGRVWVLSYRTRETAHWLEVWISTGSGETTGERVNAMGKVELFGTVVYSRVYDHTVWWHGGVEAMFLSDFTDALSRALSGSLSLA